MNNPRTLSRKLILFLSFLVVVLFSSCKAPRAISGLWSSPTPTLTAEFVDRSWLTGQPCRAPCWYGLQLETTTLDQARDVATSLWFIDPLSIQVSQALYHNPDNGKDVELNNLFLHCKQPHQRMCAVLTFHDRSLVEVSLTPNFPVSIKEVVDTIGLPDYVRESPTNFHVSYQCIIEFIWIDQQMEMTFTDSDSYAKCRSFKFFGYKPSPSLEIQNVRYRLPEKFTNLDETTENIPWSGFIE